MQKDFLEKQSGYIDRELLKDKDGQWVDILHWNSMEEAQKAAEVMMKEPTTQGFMQKIYPIKTHGIPAIQQSAKPSSIITDAFRISIRGQ